MADLRNPKSDRLFITQENKKKIDDWKDKGFFSGVQNKTLFTMAVALGLDNPTELEGIRNDYIRSETLMAKDESLITAVNIGQNYQDDDSLNDLTDWMNAKNFSEKCANTGFGKINDFVEKHIGKKFRITDKDKMPIYLEMLDELDNIYMDKVDPDDL